MSSTTVNSKTSVAKTNIILNGVSEKGEKMECMETEEEEEEEESSALELPVANPPAASVQSYQQHTQYHNRGKSPHHMQELETTTQFPMSGDLPSLDPGLPSPSLGFDMSQVYKI